jgi:hypothetical protein
VTPEIKFVRIRITRMNRMNRMKRFSSCPLFPLV